MIKSAELVHSTPTQNTSLLSTIACTLTPPCSEQSLSSGAGHGKEWGLFFLRSPVEIIASNTSDRVSRLRLEINTLEVNAHSQ